MKIEKTVRRGKAFRSVLFPAAVAVAAAAVMAVAIMTVAPAPAAAQTGWSGGARGMALADAMTAVPGDVWGPVANPALGGGAGRSAAVAAVPAPFGLTELARASALATEPFSFGAVTLAMRTEGFELYREIGARASFARPIGERLRAGIAVSYTALAIERYGSAGAVGIDAGVAVDVLPELTLGAAVAGVNEPRRGAALRERVPMTLSAGLSAAPAEGVLLCADLMAEGAYPAALRCGIEYAPIALLALRAGSESETGSFSCGIGVRASVIALDYAFRRHPELGATHALSIGVALSGGDGKDR